MELMEGRSLRPLIGELSLPQTARVLEDLLAAIDFAGKAGIVHRDLEPENALIAKGGRGKVADFGIAKAALLMKQVAEPVPDVRPGVMLASTASSAPLADSRASTAVEPLLVTDAAK